MTIERINQVIAAEMSRRTRKNWLALPSIVQIEGEAAWLEWFTDSYDACSLFEMAMTPDEYRCYTFNRMLLANRCGSDFWEFCYIDIAFMENLTPLQKCEAFLKAVNLWEEA